jgi:hypothetical protein
MPQHTKRSEDLEFGWLKAAKVEETSNGSNWPSIRSFTAMDQTHPRGIRARVLPASVFGPYAQDDEFGSLAIHPMDLYHNQATRSQGAFPYFHAAILREQSKQFRKFAFPRDYERNGPSLFVFSAPASMAGCGTRHIPIRACANVSAARTNRCGMRTRPLRGSWNTGSGAPTFARTAASRVGSTTTHEQSSGGATG